LREMEVWRCSPRLAYVDESSLNDAPRFFAAMVSRIAQLSMAMPSTHREPLILVGLNRLWPSVNVPGYRRRAEMRH
jgi:hypothetical protein